MQGFGDVQCRDIHICIQKTEMIINENCTEYLNVLLFFFFEGCQLKEGVRVPLVQRRHRDYP